MEIKEEVIHTIIFEGESFIRFGDNSWYQFYGESIEPVYHDEKLEEEFEKQLTSK